MPKANQNLLKITTTGTQKWESFRCCWCSHCGEPFFVRLKLLFGNTESITELTCPLGHNNRLTTDAKP